MEYYEEYLDHNDPLDKHEMPGEYYTGLKWWRDVANGVNMYSLNNNSDPDKIYVKTEAFRITQAAVNYYQGSLRNIYLFNTEEPESAFHYCYGKNKRDENGDAVVTSSKGWYMPGIRELELGLVTYYTDFEVIRNSFYWSAAAAYRRTILGDTGNTSARATRVTLTNGAPAYAESGSSGQPGYQARTNHNRIRAFYRVD
ncbi:MAG: hypothetical protein HDT09_02735 [Bacteroidales bacterium]|nr:hypothetical protein [Bacteroidales bacterium]